MKYDPKSPRGQVAGAMVGAENYYHTTPAPKKKLPTWSRWFAIRRGDIHRGHFRNYGIGRLPSPARRMKGEEVLIPSAGTHSACPRERRSRTSWSPSSGTLQNT